MTTAAELKELSQPIQVTPPKAVAPAFGFRLAMGLLGVLLAAMIAGLNNRVPGLMLVDIQGSLGFAKDDASWLNTLYVAGELAAMPFATWFAITFSMRRFLVTILAMTLILALCIPYVRDLNILIALRMLQGVFAGAIIPVLMMAALKFLPAPIRLHGLALYALTATFSPNIALWLAQYFVDQMQDWRWVYWHVIPLGLVAIGLVQYGVPSGPTALSRFKEADWFGMLLGVPGLILLIIAIDQGLRLDWFNSSLIQASFLLGLGLTVLFLFTEWKHPAPFIKLQLLSRRNLGLGFSVFFVLLITMSTAVVLPVNTLAQIHHLRLEQTAMIGFWVGMPQLILGSLVSYLLYKKWIDARKLFALGLLCIAVACGLGARIDATWMVNEFYLMMFLQCIGQPLTVVSLLFLATSVVQPPEGPYVSGIINTIRALGTAIGSAVVGQILYLRAQFHHQNLHYQSTTVDSESLSFAEIAASIHQQASILASADVYMLFCVVALLLIPIVLCLQYIPAPKVEG